MGFFDFLNSDKKLKYLKPSYMKPLAEYFASAQEIKEVSDAITKDGYWEENIEWKISTNTISRIEPKIENGKEWFITTVKCEQEIKIPAASIERAIIFKKIYFDFQLELLYAVGWASWKTKDTP